MKWTRYATIGLLACWLVLALVLTCQAALMDDEDDKLVPDERYNAPAGNNPRNKLPKLFDFDNYKRLFDKTYASLVEELARKKYFLSRAFRAFVSAIKFKYRQSSFYLAVNSMSDFAPEELDAMRNRELEAQSIGSQQARPVETLEDDQEELPDLTFSDEEEANEVEVQKELENLAAKHAGEPAFDELKRVMNGQEVKKRRGASGGQRLRPLPMDKLLNTGANVELDEETAAKVALKAPSSNNPNYEAPELASYGLADQLKPAVQFWEIGAPRRKPKSGKGKPSESDDSIVGSLWRSFDAIRAAALGESPVAQAGEPEEEEDEDEVYLDLRDTKCFFMPRQQGRCGSCYAFAFITIVEWLYCMKTGNLVAFSEQYMVDCGKPYIQRLNGCAGGTSVDAPDFVRNFGLELRQKYPYQMREDTCPYDPDTNPAKTGYIRFDFDDALQIHVDSMARVLKNGPIFLGISLGPGFHEYGGGVHGHGCSQKKASHAVVLVGHGREEGQEYWLIRNSHSVGWGEGGYYKMAKDANCMPQMIGWLYATRDGVRVKPRFSENKRNDESIVKRHYAKNML